MPFICQSFSGGRSVHVAAIIMVHTLQYAPHKSLVLNDSQQCGKCKLKLLRLPALAAWPGLACKRAKPATVYGTAGASCALQPHTNNCPAA